MRLSTLAIGTALAFGIAVSAAPIVYTTELSGLNEAPPNASAGTGTAEVIFDPDAHTLSVSVDFSGLTGNTTAAHIHCCTAAPFTGTAGVATQVPNFLGFPLGVTSGSYLQTFDTTLASTFNPAFVTANGGTAAGAESAFAAGLASGQTYLNIHTTEVPGGEIRGFLEASAVPEPATMSLAAAALFGLLAIRGRKR